VSHPFFINHGPFKLKNILKDIKINIDENLEDSLVDDIKDLQTAEKNI
jgi:hypothetical protein